MGSSFSNCCDNDTRETTPLLTERSERKFLQEAASLSIGSFIELENKGWKLQRKNPFFTKINGVLGFYGPSSESARKILINSIFCKQQFSLSKFSSSFYFSNDEKLDLNIFNLKTKIEESDKNYTLICINLPDFSGPIELTGFF